MTSLLLIKMCESYYEMASDKIIKIKVKTLRTLSKKDILITFCGMSQQTTEDLRR